MGLSLVRWLGILQHLRWRLGLWSPWTRKVYKRKAVVLHPVQDVAIVAAPPAMAEVALQASVDPQPTDWLAEPEEGVWPAFVGEGSFQARVQQAIAEGDLPELEYHEERSLSGWALALVGLVVLAVSLGSFFI